MKLFAIVAIAATAAFGVTAAQAEQNPAAASWTGFYVGAHAGYAWSDTSSSYTNSFLSSFDVNMKPDGEFGGVQAGYDYQLPNRIVLGVLADIALDNVSDTIPDRASDFAMRPGNTITSRTEYSGTVRARLGYAFDCLLPYVTGGYAWNHTRISASDGSLTTSKNFSGWVIGGGAEYALSGNVSLKAEYLHAEFSKKTLFPGQIYESTTEPTTDAVVIGVNYKF